MLYLLLFSNERNRKVVKNDIIMKELFNYEKGDYICVIVVLCCDIASTRV